MQSHKMPVTDKKTGIRIRISGGLSYIHRKGSVINAPIKYEKFGYRVMPKVSCGDVHKNNP